MKNSIYTIFRKELSRFFMDKRLVFSILILPGLMIFIMYSFLGNMMKKEMDEVTVYQPKVYVKELPNEIKNLFIPLNMKIVEVKEEELEQIKTEIKEKKSELLLTFSEEFDRNVQTYDVASKKEAPQIEIFYNSSRDESGYAYRTVRETLSKYEETLSNKFDINLKGDDHYNLTSKEDMTGKIFGSMLPMLLMIFMWSGCLSVAPESIAGEKERGTIATLLVTPTRRRDIALGKILALSFIAFLSGASSFIGTFTSLPKLMQGMPGEITTMTYRTMDFLMLFSVIISTVLLLVAIVSLISAFAKSVKEAATLASPVMIVIIIITFLPNLFGGDGPNPNIAYAVPLYNSVVSMNDIFKFTYNPTALAITLFSNLVALILLASLLTKAFNSEKIMFSK